MLKKVMAVFLFMSFCVGNVIFSAEKPIVAVSILPQIEIVEQIAGQDVSIVCLVPAGADPHSYEPPPSTLKKFSSARIWFQIGSGLEFEKNWEASLIAQNRQIIILNTSDTINLINDDPHVWLLPRNLITMTVNTLKGLAELLPDKKERLIQNATDYIDKLIKLDKRIMDAVKTGNITGFVCDKPAWAYFAKGYNIVSLPIFGSGRQVSAKQIKQIMDKIRAQNIPFMFESKSARNNPFVNELLSKEDLIVIEAGPLPKMPLQQFDGIAEKFEGFIRKKDKE